MTTTNTHELIEALEKADERASVKIMVKDYADGWYELEVSHRPNVEQLRQALAIQPQAEAQPGIEWRQPKDAPIGETVWGECLEDYDQVVIFQRVEQYSDGPAYLFKSQITDRYVSVLRWRPLTPVQPAGDVRERVALKNKIVSAILSYPPDTMSKAEFMADQILAALSATPVEKK